MHWLVWCLLCHSSLAGHASAEQNKLHQDTPIKVVGKQFDMHRDATLLQVAQTGGKEHVALAKKLLANAADATATDSYGYTPLHWAAVNGHARLAELLLLETPADPNARNDRDLTPLFLAAQNGHADVARVLLMHSADPLDADLGPTQGGELSEMHRKFDTDGPLEIAVRNGHQNILDLYTELNIGGGGGASSHMQPLRQAGPPSDFPVCSDRYTSHCSECSSTEGSSNLIHSLCAWMEQGQELLCEQINKPSQCKRFLDDAFVRDPLLAEFTTLCATSESSGHCLVSAKELADPLYGQHQEL